MELVTLTVTNECLLSRAFSHSISGRTGDFRDAVRNRDEGCAISNAVNPGKWRNRWGGLQAAHVFPLERGSEFQAMGGDRWITDGESLAQKLNSAQNGMILDSAIHSLFDSFSIAIDVDVSATTLNFATCMG